MPEKRRLTRYSRKVEPSGVIYIGSYGSDGLLDIGYDKHYRVQHDQDEFANSSCHINGIEFF